MDSSEPADPTGTTALIYTAPLNILAAEGTFRIRAVAERSGRFSSEVQGSYTRGDADGDGVFASVDVDDDNDGLIEITGSTMAEQLTMLHNMRYNLAGTSYDDEEADTAPNGDTGSTVGAPTSPTGNCFTGTDFDGDPSTPPTYLCGYELSASLDFDKDSNNKTWTDNMDGIYTLDYADNANPYFVVASNGSTGGWLPIGDCGIKADGTSDRCGAGGEVVDRPFIAIFDGNGFTIRNLAIQRNLIHNGFFGYTGSGALIRNIGLLDNLTSVSESISAIAVGGLIGENNGGIVVASYTTGQSSGGDGGIQLVGSLVGTNSATGQIIASYATGHSRSGNGSDFVGALVGYTTSTNMFNIAIAASYATGNANGGGGDDGVGALIGQHQSGSIIVANYATGTADGGSGTSDIVGTLFGNRAGTEPRASFGFGSTANGTLDTAPNGLLSVSPITNSAWTMLPTNMQTVASLTFAIAQDPNDRSGSNATPDDTSDDIPNPDDNKWNSATDLTAGAWNFDQRTRAELGGGPALNFADYDGDGNMFYCEGETLPKSGLRILIPNCGTLIPGQR